MQDDKHIEMGELEDHNHQKRRVMLMHSPKHIQKNLIDRFSEGNIAEDPSGSMIWDHENRLPNHLNQFFKTAEHRKRQILEKMLME